MTGSAVLHGSSPWHGSRVSRPLQARENGIAAMMEERRLVFVGWETSTVDPCGNGDESYVIDLDDCGYVIDGDDWHDDAVISELARAHGVSVADLWAAYKREQQRPREVCPVGELAGDPHEYVAGDGVVIPWDVAGDPRTGVEACRGCVSVIDQDYDNAHRCESCGVTGGGVENGLCGECAPTTCEECNGAIVVSRPGEPTPYVHLEDRGCLNSEIVPAP